jgi:hypothetical protein
MGIDITSYLVFGFKGNPKELKTRSISIWDDKYLPYIEGYRGIIDTLVKDEAETYFIFGRKLNTLDWEDDKIYTIQYQDILLDAETHRLILQFIDLFGEDVYQSLENKQPQLMTFNHYH